jgi:RimJ/RimL family protein N-acetyltransferase
MFDINPIKTAKRISGFTSAVGLPKCLDHPNVAAQVIRPVIPIRALGANHRSRIFNHLLTLNTLDRYLRFGFAVQDAHIERYVTGLNFDADEIFGVFNRKLQLIGVSHSAYVINENSKSIVEFGVSVSEASRGLGLGSRLFDRACLNATNSGVTLMHIHALTENTAMLAIIKNAGAHIEFDGKESESILQLPTATLDSHIMEILSEQIALGDYRIKHKASQFSKLLKVMTRLKK